MIASCEFLCIMEQGGFTLSSKRHTRIKLVVHHLNI